MRYVFLLIAIMGVVVSALALREHYRVEASPCSINEKWDCGIVNKSRFAVLGGIMNQVRDHFTGPQEYMDANGIMQPVNVGPEFLRKIPVAAVGIAGYLLIGVFGFLRHYRTMSVLCLGALGFSLYLTYIEAEVLGVYCIYCVISLGIISVLTLAGVGTVGAYFFKARRAQAVA